ncbi:MAG: type I methionyl aminopeptidase, partial [Patescibacteria group bacterium]|nr:type I methionyl aminopeptidase [Patescibacteria group bacterium]
GSELIFANKDGWTLKTEDGSLSGLFERTVAITKEGPLVLTPDQN